MALLQSVGGLLNFLVPPMPSAPASLCTTRQYFAAHAPEVPQWFLVVCPGILPHPEKSARLTELETRVQEAYHQDIKEAAQRCQQEGIAVLTHSESLAGLVTTYNREELDRLRTEYQAAHARWEQETARALAAQWPWYYADLVLGAERTARTAWKEPSSHEDTHTA